MQERRLSGKSFEEVKKVQELIGSMAVKIPNSNILGSGISSRKNGVDEEWVINVRIAQYKDYLRKFHRIKGIPIVYEMNTNAVASTNSVVK